MDNIRGGKAFTLVEIMIVVAIIALLAGIAIPNLLRAKMTSNDSVAKATLRAMSTAGEAYAAANSGNYPLDITSLTGASAPFLNTAYCGNTLSGYDYTCAFGITGYTFTATPMSVGITGTTTYTVTTGGILAP